MTVTVKNVAEVSGRGALQWRHHWNVLPIQDVWGLIVVTCQVVTDVTYQVVTDVTCQVVTVVTCQVVTDPRPLLLNVFRSTAIFFKDSDGEGKEGEEEEEEEEETDEVMHACCLLEAHSLAICVLSCCLFVRETYSPTRYEIPPKCVGHAFTVVSTFGPRVEATHTCQPRPLPRTGDEPADFKVSRVSRHTRRFCEADAQSGTSHHVAEVPRVPCQCSR